MTNIEPPPPGTIETSTTYQTRSFQLWQSSARQSPMTQVNTANT